MLRKTSSLEALRLYRDVLRAARNFNFPNDQGQPWSQVLARSARSEFEAARHMNDPETIARLLVTGTDALMKIQQQFEVAEQRLVHAVATGPAAAAAPPPPLVMDESPYALDHRASARGPGTGPGEAQWRVAGGTSTGAGPVLVREDGLPVQRSSSSVGLCGKAREAVSGGPAAGLPGSDTAQGQGPRPSRFKVER